MRLQIALATGIATVLITVVGALPASTDTFDVSDYQMNATVDTHGGEWPTPPGPYDANDPRNYEWHKPEGVGAFFRHFHVNAIRMGGNDCQDGTALEEKWTDINEKQKCHTWKDGRSFGSIWWAWRSYNFVLEKASDYGACTAYLFQGDDCTGKFVGFANGINTKLGDRETWCLPHFADKNHVPSKAKSMMLHCKR